MEPGILARGWAESTAGLSTPIELAAETTSTSGWISSGGCPDGCFRESLALLPVRNTRRPSRSSRIQLMCRVASPSDMTGIAPKTYLAVIRAPGAFCPVVLRSCPRIAEQRTASSHNEDATAVMDFQFIICRAPKPEWCGWILSEHLHISPVIARQVRYACMSFL